MNYFPQWETLARNIPANVPHFPISGYVPANQTSNLNSFFLLPMDREEGEGIILGPKNDCFPGWDMFCINVIKKISDPATPVIYRSH